MKLIDPSVLSILFSIVLVLNLSPLTASDLAVIPSLASEAVNVYTQSNQKENVTLTLLLSDGERWDPLLDGAKEELQKRHPDKVIELQNKTLPYEEMRPQLLEALTNGTSIDLTSIDQIWLGEFSEKGLLTDLTDFIKKGMISPAGFYQANWDGGVSENRVYAIWIWTDVRGIWYWKDLLNKSGVNPNSLKTWDGYITSAKKLNEILRPEGIEGYILLVQNTHQICGIHISGCLAVIYLI